MEECQHTMTAVASASDQDSLTRAVRETRQALDTIDDTSLASATRLGIDEVRLLKQEVAEIFPASNLPAFLLQGLLQLEDRSLKQERITADLRVLFRGSTQLGIYSAFLAAPATVLYGYQRLLALAGKDLDSAFPEGIWQFYTEFGLREDSAHHCVETIGFHQAAHSANEVDAATCWVYAAMQTLLGYDDLLANTWDEHVVPRILDSLLTERVIATLGKTLPRKQAEREQAIAEHVLALRRTYGLERLEQRWDALRPYHGPPDGRTRYASHRRSCHRAYINQAFSALPDDLRAELDRRFAERRATDLPLYQRQMAIAITLQPNNYREQRMVLPLHMARIALVLGGRYYLIDACARDDSGTLLVFPADGDATSNGTALHLTMADDGSLRDRYNNPVDIDHGGRVRLQGRVFGRVFPPPIAHVKSQIEAIMRRAPQSPRTAAASPDLLLARVQRDRQADMRVLLDDTTQADFVALRYAPIIVNWDIHDGDKPLTSIRRTHRGCGDHAMTLIRTDRSVVFDLSHVFCDAVWGMMLAEIMTGFATNLYPSVAATRTERSTVPQALSLTSTSAFLSAVGAEVLRAPAESSAETRAIDIAALGRLRRRLAKVDLLLTINDLLLLARFVHAATYAPGPTGQQALDQIAQLPEGATLAQEISRQFDEQRTLNPALLIPMDANATDPRLRLYPATFRNPLPELLPRLERCDTLVRKLRRQTTSDLAATFEEERRLFCRDLYIFGTLLRALKQVTIRGESFSTAALRLMAHLPGAVQNLVDLIPQKVGILNEILKGREVFSNVGQVASASSITRFASARDDGATKLLVWGIMSDATGRLCITLRDFRPHVAQLAQCQRGDLAQTLTQDYLDAYAACANGLATRIQRILAYK